MIVFSEYPKARSRVCASVIHFHCVSDSGMVNEKLTLPILSVVRSGKKKAVSWKFVRTCTGGGAGGAAADPDPNPGAAASTFPSVLCSAPKLISIDFLAWLE